MNMRRSGYYGVVLATVFFAVFVSPKIAWGIVPFGGKVSAVVPCTCSKNLLTTIGGKMFMVTPKSIIFAFGALKPGKSVVGIASPSAIECEIAVPHHGCQVIGAGKPIILTGTSLRIAVSSIPMPNGGGNGGSNAPKPNPNLKPANKPITPPLK